MNGVELVRELRNLDPAITLIVFSGAAQAEELMRSAVREGAYGCLRKPLDPPQLARTIAGARNTPS
jgi:CheY-like chemotaxis protein